MNETVFFCFFSWKRLWLNNSMIRSRKSQQTRKVLWSNCFWHVPDLSHSCFTHQFETCRLLRSSWNGNETLTGYLSMETIYFLVSGEQEQFSLLAYYKTLCDQDVNSFLNCSKNLLIIIHCLPLQSTHDWTSNDESYCRNSCMYSLNEDLCRTQLGKAYMIYIYGFILK